MVIVNLDRGGTETITSKRAPVTVECRVEEGCPGALITVKGIAEDSNKRIPETKQVCDVNYKPDDIYSLSFVDCTLAVGCGQDAANEAYKQARLMKNGRYTGEHFGTTGWYSAGIADIDIAIAEIIVSDQGGVIFREQNRCDYQVSCQEQCPPETYCECECGDYLCCYDRSGNPIAKIFQR